MRTFLPTVKFYPVLSSLTIFLMLILGNCQPPREEKTIDIRADVSGEGQKIEKYIYGQFIEHLGKCIYGGIWAELIEDRKFYYTIHDKFDPWGIADDPFWNTGDYKYLKASPWEVIGDGQTVTMDTLNPYVGKQSPVIEVNGKSGIRQGGIGLIQGQEYVGRIILSGEQSVLPVKLDLHGNNGEMIPVEVNDISSVYSSYPISFVSTFSTDSATLEVYSEGNGQFRIGTLSLMPANNIKGWRKDVVELLKELNAPVYRWPGGNFVSGYNWRDGIGDRDKRPPRKNPAWKGVEHNDVGIHEYMELMEILETEPFIAVNTGLGTVDEVAEEIEYCNGAIDTPMGKLRAENGHPESYGVKWWAVGNEMYGEWQLGHMPLSDYVKKHTAMANAIWEKDPEAKLIGVGAVGEWSETMLSEASDKMNLISEHIYVKELDSVYAHMQQLKDNIKRVADAHRAYRKNIPGLGEKDIRIAMDEWNYWYGDYLYGELGVRYHHKDALGVAIGLHEYFRNSDIFFMANYAQTVNVIGCIKTTPTASGFAATGLPLVLYRNHYETIPIKFEVTETLLDIAMAKSEGGKTVSLAVVNPTAEQHRVFCNLDGKLTEGPVQGWVIQNDDTESYNTPGQEPQIAIEAFSIESGEKGLPVPPYSINIFSLKLEQGAD